MGRAEILLPHSRDNANIRTKLRDPLPLRPLSIASAGALLLSVCGGATTVDSDARGEPEALESQAAGDTDGTVASEDPIARWRASAEEAASDSEDYRAAARLCATMLPDDVVARLVEFPGSPIDTIRARSAGNSVTCTFAHSYTDDRDRQRASITVEHDKKPLCTAMSDDDERYDVTRGTWTEKQIGVNDFDHHSTVTCPESDIAVKVTLSVEDDTAPRGSISTSMTTSALISRSRCEKATATGSRTRRRFSTSSATDPSRDGARRAYHFPGPNGGPLRIPEGSYSLSKQNEKSLL